MNIKYANIDKSWWILHQLLKSESQKENESNSAATSILFFKNVRKNL